MPENAIGVIGGSGLYEIEGLTEVEEVRVDTPFGDPSDALIKGRLGDKLLYFLPRHGRGHRILPTEINYRANIFALKLVGVSRVISVSAVGSMREHIVPGHIVVPDQFYDHTRHRASTFFGEGLVVHVMFADPVCPDLAALLVQAGREVGATMHEGGTYLCMEGPQFSTRAESRIYRQWGVDVIGMTNATEAKLAREAELCYATLALSTDWDCWHESEEDVSIEGVLQIMSENIATSKEIIKKAVAAIPGETACACGDALRWAIITHGENITDEMKERLRPLIGKYV